MKPWDFVFTGDIHFGSPRSYRFRPDSAENWEVACGQIVKLKPDLMLNCGDLGHESWIHPDELRRIKANLGELPFPSHATAGNMDVGNKTAKYNGGTSEGRNDIGHNIRSDLVRQFESNFGPYNWSFVHKEVRFTGFCEILVGSQLPEEKQLWEWLEELKKESRPRYHVCVTHYPLFVKTLDEPTFDNRQDDQYRNWYDNVDKPGRLRVFEALKELDVDMVFSGHVHHNRVRYADGIRFQACTGTAFKKSNFLPDCNNEFGFVHCKVTENGIEPDFVPLEKVSTAEGYGPGGHEPPRDYSLAWEMPSYGDECPELWTLNREKRGG